MASLPSSRKADRLHLLTLSFFVATSLGWGVSGSALAAASLRQAEARQSVPASLPDDDSDNAADTDATPDPSPPPAQPVPRTLDDLIPAEAVADPEAWALGGAPPLAESTADPAPLREQDGASDADVLALESLAAPEAVASAEAIGRQLDDFALTLPEPITADAEGEAFAQLALPELAQGAALAEFPLNDTITLAFPAEAATFPERAAVTARFRALSALAQLERGEDTVPQVTARARADADLLTEILATYGYYGAEVVRQLSGGRRARENGAATSDASAQSAVRFDIYPGVQYRFGAIDLGALDRLPADERTGLRSAFGIVPGDPVLADRILAERSALAAALGESGYPFAELGEPELLIDHAREQGDLSLPVDPRGRYVFAGITSSDPAFLSARHLSRIARFRVGALYRESLEADLRRAILATGLVSSVTITPRESAPPQGGAPGEVAVDVAFERAPLRTITAGIGYGTEDGFKAEATWEHRNLFPPEGALRLRGIVGTRELLANVGFKRNNFMGRDQVLFFDLFASDITTVAVESRSIGVRGTFERLSNFLFQKEFSWQIGAEALITEERNRLSRIAPGARLPRREFTIAGLFGSATIDQSDDLLDPTSGYRATLFLAPEASRSQGNQDFYLRAQLDAAAYRQLGERVVLAGRVRAATIQGAELANIAPSRRLYGGGGASVRGFGFQGVGPRDPSGEATGGLALLEASVEARIATPLLDGAVQVVPFFDIGSVSQRAVPNFDFVRYAAGLGVRYKTSFGPIRIDVGVPLNRSEFDAPVVVFVGIGQAF